MMKSDLYIIQSLEPSDPWSSWALAHPDVQFFQSPYLFTLCLGMKECAALAVVIHDDDGPLASLMGIIWRNPLHNIHSWLTSRLLIIGNPLVRPGYQFDNHLMIRLTKHLLESAGKKLVYTEIRQPSHQHEMNLALVDLDFNLIPHYNMVRSLSAGIAPELSYSPARRRQLRQASEAGIRVEKAMNLDDVRSWWKMLRHHYLFHLRKPYPSLDLVTRCFEQGQAENWATVLIARKKHAIVGGMIMPYIKNQMAHAWYVVSEHVPGRKGIPAVALYHEAFKLSLNYGISQFDLMGGGYPGRESGVRRFKEGFGVTPSLSTRHRRISREEVYALGSWFTQ